MSGRGAGYCGGYDAPGYANPMGGRGMGYRWGRGRGRGWRNMFHATGMPFWARWGYGPASPGFAPWGPPTGEEETDMLKRQAASLQGELDAISKRLSELEQKPEE
jgi:hypothetical protein